MNMTKQEALQKIQALEAQENGIQAEIADLKRIVASLPEDDVPEMIEFYPGETAFYIETDLTIDMLTYGHEFEPENKKHLLFKTSYFAEMFARKVQLIANMLYFKWLHDRDYIPDWKCGKESYFITLGKYGYYPVCSRYEQIAGTIYFSTCGIAQKCADWLNSMRGQA